MVSSTGNAEFHFRTLRALQARNAARASANVVNPITAAAQPVIASAADQTNANGKRSSKEPLHSPKRQVVISFVRNSTSEINDLLMSIPPSPGNVASLLQIIEDNHSQINGINISTVFSQLLKIYLDHPEAGIWKQIKDSPLPRTACIKLGMKSIHFTEVSLSTLWMCFSHFKIDDAEFLTPLKERTRKYFQGLLNDLNFGLAVSKKHAPYAIQIIKSIGLNEKMTQSADLDFVKPILNFLFTTEILNSLCSEDLVTLLYSISKINPQNHVLFSSQVIKDRIREFDGYQIAMTLKAYFNSKAQDLELLEVALLHAKRLKEFDSKSLTIMALALSHAKYHDPDPKNNIFNILAAHAMRQLKDFNTYEIQNFLGAFAQLELRPLDLFEKMANEILSRKNYTVSELANVLLPYGLINYIHYDLLDYCNSRLVASLDQLDEHDFTNLIVSMANLTTDETPPPKYLTDFAATKNYSSDNAVVATAYALLLMKCDDTATSVMEKFKSTDSLSYTCQNQLSVIRCIFGGSFGNVPLSSQPTISRTQRNIIFLYRSLFPDLNFVEEYNLGPYQIDLALPSQKIAIEYNGPPHYTNTLRLNSTTQLKARVLEKMGWRLITISYLDWHDKSSSLRQAIVKDSLARCDLIRSA